MLSIVGYTWIETSMSVGPRRYQTAAGDPCGADTGCDVSPAFPMSLLFPYPVGICQNFWLLVFGLLGYDIMRAKKFSRKLALPPGKEFHLFLCHHQGSGGNQARILYDLLTAHGCKVWYD